MVTRAQTAYAKARLFKGKALLIFGPRQVGKTTFVQHLVAGLNKKNIFLKRRRIGCTYFIRKS
jgi:uncharacterized protein